MMRRPTGRIAANRVTIQPTSFTQDGDGGRVVTPYGAPSPPIACRVHPASASDVPDHMREEGVVYYAVHFFGIHPPWIAVRFLITWLDFTPNPVLTVLGPAYTPTGEAGTWIVPCEYRQPPAAGQS